MPASRPRYFIADETRGTGWPHIFPNEKSDRICSFVFDTTDGTFSDLTIDGRIADFFGQAWEGMKADIAESIRLHIAIHSDPEMKATSDLAIYESDVKPSIDPSQILSFPAPYSR